MEHLCFFTLFLGVLSSTFGTTVNPSAVNLEETVIYLKQRAAEMEARVSFLENRNADDSDRRNDLSVKLEELQRRTLEQRDEVLKKVAEVETRCEQSVTNVAEKLRNAESRFLKVDNHLLMEVLQLKPMLKEATKKVRSVEEAMANALERERLKTHSLQVQITELNSELHSVDLIRKNMSSMADNLRLQLNESLSDITRNMRIIENSSLKYSKDCANFSYVSKLDENLKNLEKISKSELETLQYDLSPRLEKVEVRSALCDDVPEMKTTLTNHSSQLSKLNKSLWDVESLGTCDSTPPSVLNGKPLKFDRRLKSVVNYECDQDFVMAGNSTVVCKWSKWTGLPPACIFFDTTFLLVAVMNSNITCYSDRYFQKIAFSRVVDTGSGKELPADASIQVKRAVLDLSRVWNDDRILGVYGCEFRVDGRSDRIVAPYHFSRRVYIGVNVKFGHLSKVVNIGDTVRLRVRLSGAEMSKYKWRFNGVRIPRWDSQSQVEISDVKPADEGIYDFYHEEHKFGQDQILIRLIVRKCGKNRYGGKCEKECPVCYNGGICHDVLGVCICPVGFSGNNCEFAGGENHVSAELCRGNGCWEKFFCKPDPYGCSCFPGFKGYWCRDACNPGSYGADCSQICHCANGHEYCDRFTGACSRGCSRGWSGQSCQIAE